MPRYTLMEEPSESQMRQANKHRRHLSQKQALYVQRLREVLQNNRRNNQSMQYAHLSNDQYANSNSKFIQLRSIGQPNNSSSKYIKFETEREEDNEPEGDSPASNRPMYVVDSSGNVDQIVRLPKIKKKSRGNTKYIKMGDIDNNQKLIIRNYMNAKLIEFKKPVKRLSKKKKSHTLDRVGELPDSPHRKFYKFKTSTPIEALSAYTNVGDSQVRELSSSTEKFRPLNRNESSRNASIPDERGNLNKVIVVHPVISRITKTESVEQPPLSSTVPRRSIVNEYSDSKYNANTLSNNIGGAMLVSKVSETQSNNTSKYVVRYKKNHDTFTEQDDPNNGQHNENTRVQWEIVDPLSLQTYFVKMKKKSLSPEASKMQRTKQNIPAIPSRDQMSKFIRNYIPEYEQIKIEELVKSESFQVIQDETMGLKTFYFGQTLNDKKNGKGIYISDKQLFEGIWENEKRIKGVEVTELGKYKGQFKDNLRWGKGEFFWSHGEYYQGEWKNGKKNGSGYWRSLKGESYMGEWKNGQVSGYGVHVMKNGQRYQGEFVNFLKHGFGKQQFPNGDKYQGRYVQGHPHGKGKYEWKNGTVYQGQFVEGYRHGRGTLNSPNRLKFEGYFKNEVISGEGKIQSANGDVFNGVFDNNKKNGHGLLDMRSEKRIIKGFWVNNQLVREQA